MRVTQFYGSALGTAGAAPYRHVNASPATSASPAPIYGLEGPGDPSQRDHVAVSVNQARNRPHTALSTAHVAELSRILDQGGACGAAGPASAAGSALEGPPAARRADTARLAKSKS